MCGRSDVTAPALYSEALRNPSSQKVGNPNVQNQSFPSPLWKTQKRRCLRQQPESRTRWPTANHRPPLPLQEIGWRQHLQQLIFVTNPDFCYHDYEVFSTSINDHFLIYAVRSFNSNFKSLYNPNKCVTYRSFNHLDEEAFKNDLSGMPWDDLIDIDDVDTALDMWVNMFMDAVDHHVPARTKIIRKKACPWITHEVVMRKRDHIYKVAIKNDAPQAWLEYQALRNRVTRMLTKCKAD